MNLNPKEDSKRIWLVIIILLLCLYPVLHTDYYTITPIQKALVKIFLWQCVMFISYFVRKIIAPYVATNETLNFIKQTQELNKVAWAIVYAADLMYYLGVALIGAIVIGLAF